MMQKNKFSNDIKNSKYLLVNQSIGKLFFDIALKISKKERVDLFTGKSFSKDFKNIKIHKAQAYINKNIFTRLITWLKFTIQLYIFLVLKKNSYKKILFVTNPPFAPFLGLILNCRFSILIYDLYPNILKSLTKNNILNFFINIIIFIWNVLNNLVFKKSDKIFTISNTMSNEIKKYFRDNITFEKKVYVVSPWSSEIKLKLNNKDIIHKSYRKKEKLKIIYSGNIGLTHPLEYLVKSIPDIKEYVEAYIIGQGPKLQTLKLISNKLKIRAKNLEFLERIDSQIKFTNFLKKADFTVVALDQRLGGASLPSKIFNSLHLGIPIISISNKKSSLALLIKKYRCGINIEPNPDFNIKIKKFFYNISNDNKKLLDLKINALEASQDFTSKNADLLVDSFLE